MTEKDHFKAVGRKIMKESSLKAMRVEEQRLDEAVLHLSTFDPRFNAVRWMVDCLQLAHEIVYSYCWMSAYAKNQSDLQDHDEFHIQYYADNCITRINSFRDKAALVAWAYYCAFNPNKKAEVLGFHKVFERLRHPVRFGLTITHQKSFLNELDRLQGTSFERMTSYRNLKVHRLEPKISLQPALERDDPRYMIPLTEDKEIDAFRKKLKQSYPNERSRKRIEKNCEIRGVLFDHIVVKYEYWNYAEVEKEAQECTYTCIDVARRLSIILRRRAPLKSR